MKKIIATDVLVVIVFFIIIHPCICINLHPYLYLLFMIDTGDNNHIISVEFTWFGHFMRSKQSFAGKHISTFGFFEINLFWSVKWLCLHFCRSQRNAYIDVYVFFCLHFLFPFSWCFYFCWLQFILMILFSLSANIQ